MLQKTETRRELGTELEWPDVVLGYIMLAISISMRCTQLQRLR